MSLQLNGDTGVTFNDASLQGAAASPFGLKNKIINGDMRIAQRGTSSVNTDASYPVDRFYMFKSSSGTFTSQQSSVVPAGFKTSLLCTVTSPDASPTTAGREYGITQNIEGYNVADMEFGNSNAKTITLSFWVRSSLTGTFGGSFSNSAYDRGYGFTYTINAANTWEQKSITFVADTSGTWVTDNGTGLRIRWSFGAGSLGTANVWGSWINGVTGQTNLISTNGATFYITGVQLEQNTSATPFERRLYDKELVSCYRYFRNYNTAGTMYGIGSTVTATVAYRWGFTMDIPMRAIPTVSLNSCLGWANTNLVGAVTVSSNISSTNNIDCDLTYSGGPTTTGLVMKVYANPPSGSITVNAEL